MGKTETGPIAINPIMVEHPVEYQDGFPVDDSQYNTATKFLINAKYADGQELEIRHDRDNGILFEGTEGRIFVNRGRLSGKPVEALTSNPLPAGALESVYKDRPLVNHFRNFFEAVVTKKEPISDVHSHHRALTTCHLAAIAARLNRPLQWDPAKEIMIDDDQAQGFVLLARRDQGLKLKCDGCSE